MGQELINLFVRSIFIENMIFAYFLYEITYVFYENMERIIKFRCSRNVLHQVFLVGSYVQICICPSVILLLDHSYYG